MAEIKIEKKKGMPMWALLLALVLLILLVWAALAMRNDDREGVPQDVAALAWSVSSAPGLFLRAHRNPTRTRAVRLTRGELQ